MRQKWTHAMISNSLRKAWRFFHANAGYCTPPGKVACAMDSAKAEREMYSRGWYVEWRNDQDADSSFVDGWTPAEQRAWNAAEHTCEGAVLRDESGRVLASLWGIFDADQGYRRIVAAELAAEALAELGE